MSRGPVNWSGAPSWALALRDTKTLEKWLTAPKQLFVSPRGEMKGAMTGYFNEPTTWVRVDMELWKEFCKQKPKQLALF